MESRQLKQKKQKNLNYTDCSVETNMLVSFVCLGQSFAKYLVSVIDCEDARENERKF